MTNPAPGHSTPLGGVGPARAARWVLAGGASLLGTAAIGALGSVGAATYVARLLLVPDKRQLDDARIVAVEDDLVVLADDEPATTPGRAGLWFDTGKGHARIGDIVDADKHRVTRKLLTVDMGEIAPGPARVDAAWFWGDPLTSLGMPYEDIEIPSELGPLPAWVVRPAPDAPRDGRWAVLVHGRGGTREECLRGIRPLRDLGLTVVIPMYRNDIGAPPSPDGRYSLGLSEWRDLDAAMAYALAQGARSLVIGGWSMGGAVTLQALAMSERSDRVDGAFFDSPVVDWVDVLAYQAKLNRVPPPILGLARQMIGGRSGKHLVGVHEPLDFALTQWVRRADELRHRMLIMHSWDDGFVPAGPSHELAQARPDLVRLEEWHGARHCMCWNTDDARWEGAVRAFVTDIDRPGPADSLRRASATG